MKTTLRAAFEAVKVDVRVEPPPLVKMVVRVLNKRDAYVAQRNSSKRERKGTAAPSK